MIVRKTLDIEDFDVREAYGVKADGVTIRWISEKRLGGPEYMHNFALRYFVIKPEGFMPKHKHPWEQEVIMTKGRVLVTSAGTKREVGPGDVVYIPADEEHEFKNVGEEPVEFYCVIGCVGEGENCIGLEEL
ncbi:MAG: cupin domain-containing protein [Nitrososphaeria archaeon]|nr:cupin domain-containing protein [Nitrososphaeria archaeon]NIQ33943.1 cupin domain-containing protein [Nitrososphaeria archaeon]